MKYVVRGAAYNVEGEICPRFVEAAVENPRFVYFQTKVFGSAPYGNELYDFKLLRSGKPSAEQRKVDIASDTAKFILSQMMYDSNLSHINISTGTYEDVFDIFPVVIDGRIYGLNVDISSNINNRVNIRYDNFTVKNGLSASVAIHILNNINNIKSETLSRWRGIIGYANLIVDYHGNHLLITYDANKVRDAEGKEYLRNIYTKEYENPLLPLCVQCKLNCEKRLNRLMQ